MEPIGETVMGQNTWRAAPGLSLRIGHRTGGKRREARVRSWRLAGGFRGMLIFLWEVVAQVVANSAFNHNAPAGVRAPAGHEQLKPAGACKR